MTPSPASRVPKIPARLRLAQTPTPLQDAPRLAKLLGVGRLLIKRDDLTGSTLSGNKIRKLEFSLAEARRLCANVIITAGGIQSNHCRATAIACADLGLSAHLILRGSAQPPFDGNLLLGTLAGATVTMLPAEAYSTTRPEIVAQLTNDYARAGKRAYWIPVGASNAIGALGYLRAYNELMAQADRIGARVHHIVSATGSGGTTAGLIAGRALDSARGARRPDIHGINVCDDAPYFECEIRGILDEMNARFALNLTARTTPISILDGYVGEGYAIPYDAEIETLRAVAATSGLILDPVYTAKAMHGLREETRKGRFTRRDTVVFLHTGGMFGLFPQRSAVSPGAINS